MRFRKIGSALKSFASNTFNRVKRGMQIAAPKLLQLGSAGLGILAKTPGAIGAVSSVAKTGVDMLKDIVGHVPNQTAKNKLTNILDKGSGFVDKAATTMNTVANKAKPLLITGMNVASQINERLQ
jgi:hypothetical protein